MAQHHSNARDSSRRQKIVEEIYDSERTYIAQLNTIVDLFFKPLQSNGLLPSTSSIVIFSNIKAILAVNTELLCFMNRNGIAEAFSYLGPFLKLYASYSSNYQTAIDKLEESLKQYKEFSDFIDIQESRPECCYLNLQALLITPVQRVPRYKLLLDDLLKNTRQTHADYSKIKEAAQQISTVAFYINEYIRQHDNFKKMVLIQASFTGGFVPGIIAPGRSFVKEGKLMKICKRKPKERIVFLFSDMLLYARYSMIDVNSKSYSCRGMFPLLNAQLQMLPNYISSDTNATIMLKITTDDSNSLIFFSKTANKTYKWAKAIQDVINDLQNTLWASSKLSLVKKTSPETLESAQSRATELNSIDVNNHDINDLESVQLLADTQTTHLETHSMLLSTASATTQSACCNVM